MPGPWASRSPIYPAWISNRHSRIRGPTTAKVGPALCVPVPNAAGEALALLHAVHAAHILSALGL
jgi:hypothetical protein